MAASQQPGAARLKRGILARPLDALVFLLPLILFAELAARSGREQLIASVLLRRFFELFGAAGMWAPALAVIAILLATQVASGEKWVIRWKHVAAMYLEATAFCVPLVVLSWAIPLGSWGLGGPPAEGQDHLGLATIALGVGAGIYEELVFRLILLSIIVMIGVDLLRFKRVSVALGAILGTSLLFALHHHQPIGAEPFDPTRFVFRTIAGVYLALIFWYRGYGSAAGCHAAYNVALVVL